MPLVAERLWQSADRRAVLERVGGDPTQLHLTVDLPEQPRFPVRFYLDDTERAATDSRSLEALAAAARATPGLYDGRRAQTDPPRTLLDPIWKHADGHAHVAPDDTGTLWLTIAPYPGNRQHSVTLALTTAESTRLSSAGDTILELCTFIEARPELYVMRPPKLRRPGDARILFSDHRAQWMLLDEPAGLFLETLIYSGFVVDVLRFALDPGETTRMSSWKAASKLATHATRHPSAYSRRSR